jgi:hypothetical protein
VSLSFFFTVFFFCCLEAVICASICDFHTLLPLSKLVDSGVRTGPANPLTCPCCSSWLVSVISRLRHNNECHLKLVKVHAADERPRVYDSHKDVVAYAPSPSPTLRTVTSGRKQEGPSFPRPARKAADAACCRPRRASNSQSLVVSGLPRGLIGKS